MFIQKEFSRCLQACRAHLSPLESGCLVGMQGVSVAGTTRIHGIGRRWRSWQALRADAPSLERELQRQLSDASIYSRATDHTERRDRGWQIARGSAY
jgi:hypothetical protein